MRSARTVTAIDAHAGGEPLRIVTAGSGGVPALPGRTLLERRTYLREHYDELRRFLLWEPRGHTDMYGAVLTPLDNPAADYGVIFLTNEGYSTMCGHGIIALTSTLIETGTVPVSGDEASIVYDTPAGLVRAGATIVDGRVGAVRFRNVPAFRLHANVEVRTSVGAVGVDVAFGGAWYAIVPAAALEVDVEPRQATRLAALGMEIKRAVNDAIRVVHPEQPHLAGLYGTIITAPATSSDAGGRNVTVYADGAIDRSPCGTGTSARLACLAADGALSTGDEFVHESILGSRFTGRILGDTVVGGSAGVETEISGRGHLTALHTFLADPTDELCDGFLLG
ncbi:MAG: proline racemase family protein [Chloroflexota bacterium]|nr:proline racemase family protein [Chloroflexota bacterium]